MKSCEWNASSVAILVQDDIFVFCSPFQAEKSFADLAVAIESGEATVLAEPVGTEIVLSWWKGRERWQLARGAEMRRHLLRSDRGERYGADVHVKNPKLWCVCLVPAQKLAIMSFDAVAHGVALWKNMQCAGRV